MDGELLQRYAEAQKFLFLAQQCLNLITKSYDPILRGFGLNHSQYLVLMIMNYADITDQQVISTELSYLLGREKHTISTLVEGLVKSGCIERGNHLNDRRIITLTLTSKGKKLIEEVQPLTIPIIAEIPLGSGENVDRLFNTLETFRKTFAIKAGQDPDLYSGTFNRLLVGGERALIGKADASTREEE